MLIHAFSLSASHFVSCTVHLPSCCVAGVALMALGGALGLGLGARDAGEAAPLLCGRRGRNSS